MIVGLDIGTSKVVAVVGEVNPDGGIEVVGIGSHPSRGMKKGVVVNIESTVSAIQRAVEEAELMAGCQIHSVYVGIAGSHIRSVNSHGIVAIRAAHRGWLAAMYILLFVLMPMSLFAIALTGFFDHWLDYRKRAQR